jgi:hypothetical protein
VASVTFSEAARQLGYKTRAVLYREKGAGRIEAYLTADRKRINMAPEGLPTLAEHLGIRQTIEGQGLLQRQATGDALEQITRDKARRLAAQADSAELQRDELRRRARVAEGQPDPARVLAECEGALYRISLALAEETGAVAVAIMEAAGASSMFLDRIREEIARPAIDHLRERCDAELGGLSVVYANHRRTAAEWVAAFRDGAAGEDAAMAKLETIATAIYVLADRLEAGQREELLGVLR